jgi:hypothetical protein
VGNYSGMRRRTTYWKEKGQEPPPGDTNKPAPPSKSRAAHKNWQAMLNHEHPDAVKAEETYVCILAITGNPAAAYRASGYPLEDDYGNPVPDSTISRRGKQLAKLPRIQKAVNEYKSLVQAKASKEWSRDEILDGYRELYNVARKHLETEIVTDTGDVLTTKYNERAAANAATVLERVTNIYGFNAPAKTDSTIRFVFNGGDEAGESAGQLEQGKQYDYEAEPDTDLSDFAK